MTNLNLKFRRKYGLDWPTEVPEHLIELTLAKKWREDPYCDADLLNPVSEHMLRAATMLFTPEQLVVNPWMERIVHSWVTDEFAIHWGCAGSGKSHVLGMCCLLDYITDPFITYTLLASTTGDMLEKRSFAAVVEYLSHLRSNGKYIVPLKYNTQKREIIPEGLSSDAIANLKGVIRGTAVQQGTVQQARANLQGVHTTYVRLVLDELAGMREAAMEARHNLAQCEDFRLQAACNPESFEDLAGRYSVPVNGWDSVNLDTPEWETKWGKTYRYDAYKSPGLEDPVTFNFLPTQKSIDRIVASNGGNEDAPGVWTFLRAFPTPQGDRHAILPLHTINTFKMKEAAVWTEIYAKVAALDPAFTADGDKAVLQLATIGMRDDGVVCICFDKTFELDIEASSPRPVVYQLSDQTLDILRQYGISVANLGVDDSGTQSVADVIEAESRLRGVWRCNFAMSASDQPVGVGDQPAKERYKNRVTEMYYQMREFGQRNQVRGLSEIAANELSKRRLALNLKHQGALKKLQLESKTDFKQRTALSSPDSADAAVIIVGLAREKFGLVPGATKFEPQGLTLTPARDPYYGLRVQQYNNMDSMRSKYK
jgi:hypothetical protein